MMIGLLSIVAIGFFLGMRHATDPDHVIAVTTIVGQQRKTRPYRHNPHRWFRHHPVQPGNPGATWARDGAGSGVYADRSRIMECR
jgi:hypothetical protein